MRKLEDIGKKRIFDVPDGYFDSLPHRIRARIDGKSTAAKTAMRYGLRLAVPAIAIAISILLYVLTDHAEPKDTPSAALAKIETDELVTWLMENELDTYDLLESDAITSEDVEVIEADVYSEIMKDAGEELIEFFELDTLPK